MDDQIELRRAVPVKGIGDKYTYNTKLPMKKKLLFSLPPFEIIECSTLIEMSSTTTHDPAKGVCQVRPNILASTKDERELVIVRDAAELNACESYQMVTDSPHVKMEYEGGKKYCPKYTITYYLERPAPFKITTTILPLIFVALLSTLNVFNPEDEGGPNLENAIGIALTVVFVLPELRPTGVDQQPRIGWLGNATTNDVLIGLLFLGQIFSVIRIPDATAKTGASISKLGYAGVFFQWFAVFIIPLYNFYKYWKIKSKLKSSAMIDTAIQKRGAKPNAKRPSFVKKDSRPDATKIPEFNMWNPAEKGVVEEGEMANMVSCADYVDRKTKESPWLVKTVMKKNKKDPTKPKVVDKIFLSFGPTTETTDDIKTK